MSVLNRIVTIGILVSATALAGCGGFGGRTRPALPASSGPAPSRSPSATSPKELLSKLQGGIIGRKIGAQLSSANRQLALEAEYRALEEAPGGEPVTWQSPDGTISGTVVAAPPYQVGSQNCRQVTHTVTIDSRKEEARGAACRNSDGSWTPLS